MSTTPKQVMMRSFNTTFYEFIDDVEKMFEDKKPFIQARRNCEMIQKIKASALVQSWYQFVYVPYAAVIDAGDVAFFLDKDYSSDLGQFKDADKMMQIINTFRGPIMEMGEACTGPAMKYIQLLSKIAVKYHELA